MSLATQLGLEGTHGDLLVSASARWQEWQLEHPVLGVCDDLAALRDWLWQATPEESNKVLLALAELGAADGGDDPVATAALLWLLLPGAVGVAHALSTLSQRIDELVAAQLWICARTVSWAKGVSVAATVLMNTRREVMTDLGVSKDARTARSEVPVADLTLLRGPWSSAAPLGSETPSTASAAEDKELLQRMFKEAAAADIVSQEDCRLLMRLAERAHTHRNGRGRGGLFARSTSEEVAREWNLSRATVARRAARALEALRETYGRDVTAA